MRKRYIINGKEYLFEEGNQPRGAVELQPVTKAAEPLNKVVRPANKSRNKAVRKK